MNNKKIDKKLMTSILAVTAVLGILAFVPNASGNGLDEIHQHQVISQSFEDYALPVASNQTTVQHIAAHDLIVPRILAEDSGPFQALEIKLNNVESNFVALKTQVAVMHASILNTNSTVVTLVSMVSDIEKENILLKEQIKDLEKELTPARNAFGNLTPFSPEYQKTIEETVPVTQKTNSTTSGFTYRTSTPTDPTKNNLNAWTNLDFTHNRDLLKVYVNASADKTQTIKTIDSEINACIQVFKDILNKTPKLLPDGTDNKEIPLIKHKQKTCVVLGYVTSDTVEYLGYGMSFDVSFERSLKW